MLGILVAQIPHVFGPQVMLSCAEEPPFDGFSLESSSKPINEMYSEILREPSTYSHEAYAQSSTNAETTHLPATPQENHFAQPMAAEIRKLRGCGTLMIACRARDPF